MVNLIRVAALFTAMAFSAVSVGVVPTAQAQGLEYCRDLGVMVQHTDVGLIVRALRGRGVAGQIGLQPDDLLFAVDGYHPDSLDDLHRVLFTGADHVDHDIDILRGNQHLHVMVFHDHGEIFAHGVLQ